MPQECSANSSAKQSPSARLDPAAFAAALQKEIEAHQHAEADSRARAREAAARDFVRAKAEFIEVAGKHVHADARGVANQQALMLLYYEGRYAARLREAGPHPPEQQLDVLVMHWLSAQAPGKAEDDGQQRRALEGLHRKLDAALFHLVTVEKTALGLPDVLARIEGAQKRGDQDFFLRLSDALQAKGSRRHARKDITQTLLAAAARTCGLSYGQAEDLLHALQADPKARTSDALRKRLHPRKPA